MALTSAPPARRPGGPILLRAGALTVAGVAVTALAGCGVGMPNRLDFSDTEKVKVTEIVVSGGSGDVIVTTAPIAETRINRSISYRNAQQPGATYRLTGTVLSIDTECGDNCSVSYDIEAPAGVAVRGTLRSGDIRLTDVATADLEVTSGNVEVAGASGAVKVRASSGDITVRDAHAATHLTATSGNIEGTGLGGGALTAQASSGEISLALSKPGPVTAKATSGNVRLLVPEGTYRVDASATSGDVELGIADDRAGTYVLDVRATSGDVSISRA